MALSEFACTFNCILQILVSLSCYVNILTLKWYYSEKEALRLAVSLQQGLARPLVSITVIQHRGLNKTNTERSYLTDSLRFSRQTV